jgi:predicted DNA-binding transcriptional regulator AlpA
VRVTLPASPHPLLKIGGVRDRYGLTLYAIRRALKLGLFPKPRELGPRSRVWDQAILDVWAANIGPDALRAQLAKIKAGRFPAT